MLVLCKAVPGLILQVHTGASSEGDFVKSQHHLLPPAIERQAVAACIQHWLQVEDLRRMTAAAVVIQASWKGYKAQVAFRKLQTSVPIIQQAVRQWKFRKDLRLFQDNQAAHAVQQQARTLQQVAGPALSY